MKSKMITKKTFFYRLIRFMQWMIVLIGLVIAAPGATFALQPPEQDPETVSDRIHEFHPRLGTFYYVIHWADSKVADATITIERDGEYYRMTADEEITKFLDRTYRIKYRGETTIRAEDLAPVETVINQELGRKQTTEQIRYDAEGKADVVVTKKEPDAPVQQEAYHISEETFAIDMFSAIFLTRSFDWQENESQQFDMFSGKKRYLVTLDCIGKTVFHVGDINIDAWVIRPGVLKQNDPNAKTRHSEARVYLSADESRDLLKIRTKVGLGTVKMKLLRYEPNR
jgi:hypothetical protein